MLTTQQILRSAILTVFFGLSATLGIAAPAISSISPSSGATQGGTAITINGSGFVAVPPSTFVTLSGVSMAITSITDTRIIATTPDGQGTGKQLTVTVSGVISNAATFNYLPPSVSGITPASAGTAGGTTITLTGSNFGSSGTVSIGGLNAPITSGGYSHTTITCTLPAGQGTNLPVVVTSAGRSSNGVSFSYNPPTLTGITPATGPTAGGTLLTIAGSNFGTSASVFIGGANAPVISQSHTQLVVNSPAGEGTSRSVTVIAGGQASNSGQFSYNPPTLTGITPATGPTAGGTLITLTGSSFGTSASVFIGGANAPVISQSHTQLVVNSPAGEGTSRSVTVIAGGQVSNSGQFSYNPPTLTGISPATGPTAGGTLITLTGSSFGTSPNVFIGGANAPVISQSHTQLVVNSPAGEGTNRSVTVIAGGQVSNSGQFSYNPPTLTGISPATGPTAGGTLITLTGSSFGTSANVFIGGANAPVISQSHTQLVVNSPAGEGTSRSVTVIAGGQVSNSGQFSYLPPSISGITPASAGTVGGTTITLTGTNFGLSPEIVFNGQALSPTSSSHTQAAFLLPAGQGAGISVALRAAGQNSNPVTFNYSAPVITSVSPASGSTSGGTVITINGSNFGSSGTVFIGGLNAPVTLGGYSHTTITCTLPAGQGINLPVVVTSAGRSSNSVSFSYNPPSLTGITPATGPTAGGTLITLTGSNFGISPTVLLGSSQVSPSSSSHGQLVFVLPAGEGRNLPVRISAGGQESSSTSFSYGDPVLTGITAASYPTAGAVPITLTGSNFGINPTVHVGTSVAPVVSIASDHSQIVCTLPAGQGIGKSVTVTVAGTPSNALSLDYDAPEIASITPASGSTSGGTVITINGSNFGSSGTVSIGGLNAPITSGGYSHTTITCTLPAGQGTNLPVVVTSAGRSSNSVSFSYNPPTLTGISPATGPTAGGTLITLTGSNFGTSPNVFIGGANAPVISQSHTQLVVNSPAGEGTSRSVTVIAGGQASNSEQFSYLPPSVSGITPASAGTAGGTTITLTGTNFGLSGTVSIGGLNAPVTSGGYSHTTITCTLPAGQGTNLPVVVTSAGRSSNGVSFSYNPPTLTGITPATGPTAGGTLITLTGSNFGTSASVFIGGANAPVISQSHTQLVVNSPAGEGTSRSVTVIAGGQVSNSGQFSYLPPSVSGITPASAGTAGGTLITLTGTNFGLSPEIVFNGQALSPTSSSHTQVAFLLPAGQGAGISVALRAAGQNSNPVTFNYSAPVITSVSPASGSTSGGTVITINGSNFGSSGTVFIGGQNAPVTSGGYSHTMITCTLPAGQGINLPVVVTSAGRSSNSVSFSYNPPSLTGISPATGPTAGGTLITLTGSNFGTSPTVLLGSSQVSPSSSSHGQLVFELPAGEGSNLPVRISAGGQESSSTSFSYGDPVLTGITAASYPTAGAVPITLTGSNFGINPTVHVGTSVAPVVSIASDHSQIVCTLPSGQGIGKSVTVTVAGTPSNALSLDYDAPEIVSITPASGSTSGGTVITINGSNFGSSGTVFIGGLNAPVTSGGYSHTTITCTLPAGQGTNLPVVVTSAGRLSNSVSFSYNPPTLTGITPATGPTAGGTLITLTGSNFGTSPTVLLGSSQVSPSSSSHGQLVFELPAGEGVNQAVVVTAGNQSSTALEFDYLAPAITGISAAAYPTSGGTIITITGTNFGLNQTVLIGGQGTSLQPGSSHTQVTCTLPAGQGTNVPVTLTAGGQVSPAAFINYDAPAITSISPGNGPTSGGIPITINGSNFGLTPRVTLGGKAATTLSIAHSQIVFTLPSGGGADRQLTVTTEEQVSNAVLFDYDGDTFSSWSDSIAWNGLDSSPGADPRQTGWKNVLAYALGVDPITTTGGETASRLPRVYGRPAFTRDSSGRLQISFWRRRGTSSPDLVYQVQFSNNPGAASWDPPAADPQIEVVDATWEFCTFRDAETTSTTRFCRVKVELVTPP